MAENESYEIYKGLQKPLVFKGFKGRYIYWMGGGLVGSFMLCVIFCVAISYIAGGIVLIVGVVGTGMLVNKRQKSGVHSKTRTKGVIYFDPVHNKFASRTVNKEI